MRPSIQISKKPAKVEAWLGTTHKAIEAVAGELNTAITKRASADACYKVKTHVADAQRELDAMLYEKCVVVVFVGYCVFTHLLSQVFEVVRRH